jgi:MFS family permease
MLNILSNRTYRHLFMAQVIALIGTGLATVALGLLAYDLAGDRAGAVLGTALAIKMSAYILVAPVAAAFADKFPRRTMLVTLDLVRALVAIAPFVTQIWEIYILIFVLQSASAAFTPTFQATIPDILPDEREYTRALSLSRGLRSGKRYQPDAGGGAADGHELPQSVCRYGGRFRLCGSGCFRVVAKNESVNRQTQHL